MGSWRGGQRNAIGGTRARTELVRWLGSAILLPYDERVAWKWGQLSVLSERRGRARPINDTWIAACCLVAGLPLATRNLKDFADFAMYDSLRVIGLNE